MHAAILHADADAFFAAVEQRDDPALRGRPLVVGTGVVMAASYEARAYGIRGGMGGRRARRLCPGLLAVPPRFDAYVEAGRALRAAFERAAPLVQPLSMEEAFLGVSGREPPRAVAERLRREIRDEVGLAVTVGVARTALLAKQASRAAKPDGLLEVPPERERAFLGALAVEEVWGIGPATARRLRAHGIRTMARAAELEERDLMAVAGKAAGRYVHLAARGGDPRPVQPPGPPRSFGSQRAMRRAPESEEELQATLARVVERSVRRMAAAGHAGRTIHLRLRFGDYERAARARTLARAAADPAPFLAAAQALLDEARPAIARRGLTLLGVTIANLDPRGAGVQLALLDPASTGAPGTEPAGLSPRPAGRPRP